MLYNVLCALEAQHRDRLILTWSRTTRPIRERRHSLVRSYLYLSIENHATILKISLPYFGLGRAMKKKRKYNIRLIRERRSYTMGEIAELLKVHVRTAQVWHKNGMKPIDPDDRPLLFLGLEIKRHLSQGQSSRKCPLKEDEFFCPRCRTARTSCPSDVHIVDTGRRMGKVDFSVMIKGICTECECRLTRFCTRRTLEKSVWARTLKQGQARLYRDRKTTVNTDLEGGDCGTD